jgi:hypothetical protein
MSTTSDFQRCLLFSLFVTTAIFLGCVAGGMSLRAFLG